MERKEYLHLCQKASAYVGTDYDLPAEVLMEFEGIVYYPHGYELTFEKGVPKHTAILHDLRANSLTYAKLERVEKYGQGQRD